MHVPNLRVKHSYNDRIRVQNFSDLSVTKTISKEPNVSACALTTRVCVPLFQILVRDYGSRRNAGKVSKSGVAVRRVFRIAVAVEVLTALCVLSRVYAGV